MAVAVAVVMAVACRVGVGGAQTPVVEKSSTAASISCWGASRSPSPTMLQALLMPTCVLEERESRSSETCKRGGGTSSGRHSRSAQSGPSEIPVRFRLGCPLEPHSPNHARQREHSIWSRPPPSSPSRYSHSCSWSSCSRQARTTIARDTSTIPMNVGRDERLRPADALGPMAALPTSTSRPSCPQTILWAQCLHAGSLLPAFLAFLGRLSCRLGVPSTASHTPNRRRTVLRCLCSHLDLRRRLLCRPVVAINFWAASFSDATNVSRTASSEAEVFMGSPTVA